MSHLQDRPSAVVSNDPVAVELACDAGCLLAESPVWDDLRGEIFWCDILGGTIHRYSPYARTHATISLPGKVGSLGLTESGRLVVAHNMDVLLLDPDTGAREILHTLPAAGMPFRLNDGCVGPDGAFWVGSMHDVELDRMEPRGSIWRVTVESAEEVVTGLKCPNGAAFDADGTRFWHSDSLQQWVRRYAFDRATGRLGEGVLICEPDTATGRPDGAAIDADGIYWSAGVSAGVLNGFDRDGRLVRRIPLPVPHPTMPCFGGEDLKTLYVTSHRNGMDGAARAASPWSGSLMALRMDRPGQPARRFREE